MDLEKFSKSNLLLERQLDVTTVTQLDVTYISSPLPS